MKMMNERGRLLNRMLNNTHIWINDAKNNQTKKYFSVSAI